MSTAGKVLTVLIMLVMVAWLVMMSAVSQLNANYGQKIQREQLELEKVADDFEKTTAAFLSTNEKARFEQEATERDVREKLARISEAERRQSFFVNSLTAVEEQVKGTTRDAVNARKNLDNREAEKIKDEELLAKKRDEIAKAQALNAELKGQLAQLQEEFKRLLAENAAKVKAPAAQPVSSINGPSS